MSHFKLPVISIGFNRFLVVLLTQFAFASALSAQLPALSLEQKTWLGTRIFDNECGGRFDCLTSWNEGEEFPSLGIGHFIWYAPGQRAPFEETFPALLDYLESQGATLPPWLQDSPQESPWLSRAHFYDEYDGERMRALREFLFATRGLQADFIVTRMADSWHDILAEDVGEQNLLADRLAAIAAAHPPDGVYALIDYTHFKGTGLNPDERYGGQGWGLMQVLQLLPPAPDLEDFVASAETVLRRRIANAPFERGEQRWLAGWLNRVQTYLPGTP